MSEKFGGHSSKTRNMLGIGLMIKGDYERACKVFRDYLDERQLDNAENAAVLTKGDNPDLSCLIVNYIKCNTILNGQGQGAEFLKGDEVNKMLFGYLVKMNSPLAREFFEERQKAEAMFDEAVASMQ